MSHWAALLAPRRLARASGELGVDSRKLRTTTSVSTCSRTVLLKCASASAASVACTIRSTGDDNPSRPGVFSVIWPTPTKMGIRSLALLLISRSP